MSLLSVERALDLVLDGTGVTAAQTVPLDQAAGRILASPLEAKLTQPPFAASAMDGYALRVADLTDPAPVRLKLIGAAAAGHPFDGEVSPGEAIRIFTGAPLAKGTDTVIMQENTSTDDTSPDVVNIDNTKISPGFVRPKGMDFTAGDKLLPTGTKLGPRELSLAAAMGHNEVRVHRKPVVAILSTGDELVPPGTLPGPGQIISSNQLGIAALVDAAGGRATYLGIAADTTASLNEHIDRAASADILVTIGGASVGDHDLVGPVLKDRGMDLSFWKIAMRPGKPMMFGTLKSQRILGLPGNPISSLISSRIFLVPLIRTLLGLPPQDQHPRQAFLAAPLPANGPRQHYMRAIQTTEADGTTCVTPDRSQDSSLLSAFTSADCLIVHPPHTPAMQAGERVDILSFDL